MIEDPVPPGTFFIDLKSVAKDHSGLKLVLDQILGLSSLGESIEIGNADEFTTNLSRYFRYEERMMEMVHYPLYAVHAAEHRKILDLSSNALTAGTGHRGTLDAIAENLRDMFRAHEERFDMVLNDYLRKKYAL